ncbi:hypothetical protein, partial [Algoriphagus boritolerans]|uniref:hypothetical protein n=1 Tax=Algoriphagus boritolerans TaxID=308111 RepID=UPI002FCE4EE0
LHPRLPTSRTYSTLSLYCFSPGKFFWSELIPKSTRTLNSKHSGSQPIPQLSHSSSPQNIGHPASDIQQH